MSNVVALPTKKKNHPTTENRKVLPKRLRNAELRTREYLTPEEVERLISQAAKLGRHGSRDGALLMLAYRHGLRVSELCQLKGTDIDSGRMVIQVRQGKGKRDRLVGLSPDLLPLLRRYWKQYQLQSWLFPGQRVTEPLTRMGVTHICKRAGREARIKKTVYPHLLRHSFATHLLKGRADIRQIQKLLGHVCLSSTEIYTKVEVSDLRAVLKRCHPREKKR